MEGDHKTCFNTSVQSAADAIMELLENSDQQWICAICMHKPGHKAMSSITDKACSTCNLALRLTVENYSTMWMKSLMFKAGFVTDLAKNSQECNYSKVAEYLVYPHGERNGMTKPGKQSVGPEATCSCKKQVGNHEPTEPEAEIAGSDSGAGPSEDELMDTSNQDNLTGKDPLITHFKGSCKMLSMLDLIPDDYCKELLSTRLHGNEIKEGMAITILGNYKRENPCLNPPAWFPDELLGKSEEELKDRMDYLTRKSLTQTSKEVKAGQELTLHPGVTRSAHGKRKLQMNTSDDLDQRPVKQAKTFTTTPEEMVKLFAQYSQATATALNTRINPLRTMELLVEKVEKSRKKQQSVLPGTKSVPQGTALDQEPVVGAEEDQPGHSGQGGSKSVTKGLKVTTPKHSTPPPADATTRGGGGHSNGRGRGRGGRGGSNQQSGAQTSQVGAVGGPVRCSYPTGPNTFCSTFNFPEALRCRVCGGGLQNYRAQNSAHRQQRGGGRGFRGRGGRGFRSRGGRT